MEATDIADAAMRERVELRHLAQNVLTDTIVPELAQKVMPELSENIAEWSLEDIRELLPILDSEASRILQQDFPNLDLSAYDCVQIFRKRIALLQSLLAEKRTAITPWQCAGNLSALRRTLKRDITTLQATTDITAHMAGLAIGSVLLQSGIASPPPENASWGDTAEWRELRAAIVAARAAIQRAIMLGN